jgi:hypothetical protein
MALYVFRHDGSEYSRDLREGLDLLGVETVQIDDASELETVSAVGLAAVVLANPTQRVAREVRAVMNEAGGWLSQLPLLAAVENINRLDDTETPGTSQRQTHRHDIQRVRAPAYAGILAGSSLLA